MPLLSVGAVFCRRWTCLTVLVFFLRWRPLWPVSMSWRRWRKCGNKTSSSETRNGNWRIRSKIWRWRFVTDILRSLIWLGWHIDFMVVAVLSFHFERRWILSDMIWSSRITLMKGPGLTLNITVFLPCVFFSSSFIAIRFCMFSLSTPTISCPSADGNVPGRGGGKGPGDRLAEENHQLLGRFLAWWRFNDS